MASDSITILGEKIKYRGAFDQYTTGTTGKITVDNNTNNAIFVRVSKTDSSTQAFVVIAADKGTDFDRTLLETIWVSGIKGGPITSYLGIPGLALNINNPTDGP